MFQGLRTAIYRVKPKDLETAKQWYSEVLGQKPYFDEPFYVGFSVGGFELGLNPSEDGEDPIKIGNNVQVYWGVPDIKAAFKHCLKHDAKVDSEIQEVGEGIKVAIVRDPFSNLFGLIENPHFRSKKRNDVLSLARRGS